MPYLIPLEIRGLGTPDIEALSSYIHRLACAHEVTVATLLKKVAAWYQAAHPDLVKEITKPGAAGDLSVYIRPNQGTADLVKMLIAAVNEPDLVATTFISLQNALDRSAGVFSRHMRWCPLCMKESQAQGESGYFKLLWTLKAITHCPEHRIELMDECSVCGAKQGGYGYKTEPCKCQKCDNYLSEGKVEDSSFTNSWNLSGADMFHLVDYISRNPQVVFPKDGVRAALSDLFDKAWRDGEEEKLWSIYPRDELLCVIDGITPMTITGARKIAYKFGLNLEDVLSGDISQSPEILNAEWSRKLPKDLRPKIRKKNYARDNILEKIHKAMKLYKDSPKPLVFYAGHVSVSTGYLNYHYPVLSKRIVAGHQKWKNAENTRKKQQANNEVLNLIAGGDSPHMLISRKRALREIRRKTGLPKNVVREAINDVFEKVVLGKQCLRSH